MSLDPNEKEEIILEVIERILTKMPSVIGNLMTHHAKMNKMKKEFFDKNKEFVNHKDIVASVIEKSEGESLVKSPDDIFNDAIPEIKRRISLLNKLDIKTKKEPENKTVLEDFSNGLI